MVPGLVPHQVVLDALIVEEAGGAIDFNGEGMGDKMVVGFR